MADAVTIANTIKTSGTRIISLGIGNDLNTDNLKAISGPTVGTNLSADVITSDFASLASTLATFATQTCGGTISVRKIINGNANAPLNNWQFNINNQNYSTDAQGYTTAIPVTSGTYSVVETQKNGYSLSSAVCVKNSVPVGSSITDGVGSIAVGSNDIVSCTFTNDYLSSCGDGILSPNEPCDGNLGVPSGYSCSECTLVRNTGTITVDKVTNPSGDQTNFPFTVVSSETNTNESFILSDQNIPWSMTLPTGAYTVSEGTLPAGWLLSNITCVSNQHGTPISRTFDLDNGENVTCTFTNTKSPTLTVNKILNPVGHGNFNLLIDGSIKASSVGNGGTTGQQVVSVGSHTVGEVSSNPSTVLSDYKVTYGGDCSSDGTVTLAAGENKTCTITNVAYGSVLITKDVIPDDSSVWDFTLNGTGGNYSANDLGNNQSHLFSHLIPGTYNLTEITDSNYSTEIICGGVSSGNNGYLLSLSPGQNIQCVAKNTIKSFCGDGFINQDSEQCDGSDLGGLSSTDFQCTNSCNLKLVEEKVTICHATSAHNNPYITNEPNKSGDVSGHSGHTGPIWYPGITISWGDIIPPFAYVGGTFPGLNWTTEGQAVYNDGCNFAKGHLIVQKTTLPSGDNTSFSISASGTGDISGNSAGTIKDNVDKNYEVTPGIYSVTETVPSGWVKTGDTCQNVTVNAGETKYCTFTNTKKGSLKIIKDSQPNDTQNFIFRVTKEGSNIGSVELDDDGDTTHSRSNNYTFTNLVSGTYKVTEDSVAGWTLDNITCTNTTGPWGFSGGYLTVDILPGENPICTFTNGLDSGTLIAHKFEDNNLNQRQNSGEADLKDWDMNLYQGSNCHSGNYLRDLDTNNDGDANFGNLVPGNYSVKETLKSGWKNTTPLCQNITINHNDNKVLNFGNYQLGKIEGKKFYDKNGNGNRDNGEDYLKDWKIFIDENGNGHYNSGEDYIYTNSSGYYKFDNLSVGNYTICEQMKSGWYNSTPICKSTYISADDTDTINFGNMKYGSIRVCKIIIDGDNKVVNGSETPGASFTINWNNGLSPTIFNTGYTANTRLLKSTPHHKKDAYCTTISNLEITNYRYSQELISDTTIWQTPKYNDQYDDNVHNLGDFYTYNSNTNSNGDINLALDPPGINRTLVILNQYKFGQIEVFKFNDLNGNGERDCIDNNSEEQLERKIMCEMEPLLPEWTINLSDNGSKVTDENGSVMFDQLTPDTYALSETIQNGWTQTGIICSNDSEPTPTVTPEVCGCNSNLIGDAVCNPSCNVGVCNWDGGDCGVTPTPGDCNDVDRDGICEVNDNCPTVANPDQGDSNNNGIGNVCEMTVFKLVKPVMAVTEIVSDSYNHKLVDVGAGENVHCYIGNQRLDPKFSIAKFNNVIGDLSPGNSVEYTIDLGIAQNDVKNLKVTDLLSNGFKYRLGSYKVYLNGTEVVIPEPHYASPGVWDLSSLGTLTPEDELRLVYIADISTDQQPGKYTDLAWASANYAYDSSKYLLASAQPTGYIDPNFVGTIVPVVKNTQNSVSAEVEQKVEGQVLGASTEELPGTGASALWLILSSLLGIVGFSLLKINKKNMLILLLALLSFGLMAKTVYAADFVLSIQELKTPSNTKDLKLEFKALHLNNGVITAKCLKKGPNDSGFSQFGSNIVLTAGGNSSHCDLSLAINDNGSYQFSVEANDSVNTLSKTVSLDYNTSTPGTPRDYRKEKINDCDFKIHFKTDADNGKTVKVELYRSTDSNFSANNESLVHSVNIGSDQEYDINNSVPDCSKTYYYALRAFDNAGNGSGLVGDRITVTATTTTTETAAGQVGQSTGAIPVIGADIPPEGESATTEEGQEEITLGGETGQVLGTEEGKIGNFITEHKIISILIALVILGIIIYAIKKFKKNKKR